MSIFESLLGIEGVRQLVVGFVDFGSLHLVRLNNYLKRHADEEMDRRSLRVTSADVAAGTLVDSLSLHSLIGISKPGQPIRLSGGLYVLGDESVGGHAACKIVYDTNGDENGGCYCGASTYSSCS